MQWFKHDSNASSDAKIKKLLIRHGAIGYAVYFHCIELITNDLSSSNITFELEHDSEIIADNLKIQGDSNRSGREVVEEIMRTIVELGLFNESRGKIYCYKLAKRIDSSMIGSTEMRKMMDNFKKNHDTIMIPSEQKRLDNNTIEKKTKEKPKRKAYGSEKNVYLSDDELEKLYSEFSRTLVDKKIEDMSLYCKTHGKHYKSYKAALLLWLRKDDKPSTDTSKPKTHTVKPCPECGDLLKMGYCPNCDKDYNGVEL